jgi:hypothetical protein
MALRDRAWKEADQPHFQSIQRHPIEMSSIDPVKHKTPAIAIGWQRFKLTRAAVIAIAAAELHSVNFPIDRHGSLPLSSMWLCGR